MDPFFPEFFLVPSALGQFDGVFRSQIFQISRKDSFHMEADSLALPFFHQILVVLFPHHVGNGIETCNSATREGARIYMTDLSQTLNRHGISLMSNEFSCLLPDPCEDVCPLTVNQF